MGEVKFVETTIRDGQLSLWGSLMTTAMILPIAAELDNIGYESIEADSFNMMKLRILREKEDPWARIRLLVNKIKKTPLTTMAGHTFGTFSETQPLAIAELLIKRLAANGIRRVRVFGFMNDMKFLTPEVVRFAHQAGLEVQMGLIFALSPRHTDEYYALKTREAMQLKVDRIYLKDPIGLLTPERTQTIIPAILKHCGKVPLELHSHCTTGLAPICYFEALKAGVNIFHTSIPPLANGSAPPSILNIARNAVLLGYTPKMNEAIVKHVSNHFYAIARHEGFPVGAPLEYDYAQILHQVPGGVISNLKRQLTELGIGHRLEEVLQEIMRVREDLGYPIMYTPFSQLVVTQAAMNVFVGKRYDVVPDEVIKYILGYWGEETSCGVKEEVKFKILDRPRAQELARAGVFEPTIAEVRQKLGGEGVSDDDLIMRYMMGGDEHLKNLRPAHTIKEYSIEMPLMRLIKGLLDQNKRKLHCIKIEKKNFYFHASRTSAEVKT